MTHAAAAFSDLARAYIRLVDEGPTPFDLKTLVHHLLDLYRQAEDLPQLEVRDLAPAMPADHELLRRRRRLPAGALPVDYYWCALDRLESAPSEVGCGQVYDDIQSIRDDLADGLWLWDDGLHDLPVDEWRTGWEIHWGQHLTDAVTVLHEWRTSRDGMSAIRAGPP